jgi:hypothetical protein
MEGSSGRRSDILVSTGGALPANLAGGSSTGADGAFGIRSGVTFGILGNVSCG